MTRFLATLTNAACYLPARLVAAADWLTRPPDFPIMRWPNETDEPREVDR